MMAATTPARGEHNGCESEHSQIVEAGPGKGVAEDLPLDGRSLLGLPTMHYWTRKSRRAPLAAGLSESFGSARTPMRRLLRRVRPTVVLRVS
jgi:hypothetical protein